MEKKKILLIDDDRDFLAATQLILKSGGYEVFLAENGKSGLEQAKAIAPDLIIVDMMMETWSEGFDVVSKLRTSESGKKIPLIMLSAVDLNGPYSSFEAPEGVPSVDLALNKPISAEDLLKYTGQLLA
ncbi:MAG: response regulator [Thermodesulfobacteriota bacterium]|nr:response regulator [Thermodesulfobacteriota bacterium]